MYISTSDIRTVEAGFRVGVPTDLHRQTYNFTLHTSVKYFSNVQMQEL
jgi:hypothetical protein